MKPQLYDAVSNLGYILFYLGVFCFGAQWGFAVGVLSVLGMVGFLFAVALLAAAGGAL